MTHHKLFWQFFMATLLALYAAAVVRIALGDVDHRNVQLAAIILIAHVLEIPLAFRMLKDKKPQAARAILATLLFGLVWWIPARRGIFAVA
jgi:hypothetical protein